MALRLVTFDLDDTLWDNREVIIAADRAHRDFLANEAPEAIAELTPDAWTEARRGVLARDPTLRHDVSRLRRALVTEVLVSRGWPHSRAAMLADAAFAVFMDARNRVQPFPDAERVLGELAKRYTLVSLTNGNADVGTTPLGRYFDLALRAEDVGKAKPEPDLFLAALAHAGVDPAQAAHVGDDVDTDVRGARAAGLHAVWYRGQDNAGQPHAGPLGPSATVRQLGELPGVLAGLG